MINENVINEFVELLGKDYYSTLEVKQVETTNKQELKVVKKGNKVTISYGEPIAFFRGLSYLYEHKNEDFDVTFNRNFIYNGLMVDCSRNGVVNLETLKFIIKLLAAYGLNRLLLYTEDTYEIEEYPYFGYLRGRYSKKELKAIDDFAYSYGVELVPCIQTLGHLENPLRWACFRNVRDSADTLLVEEEETYKFIEAMLKTCRECFRSKNIHIGMDEAFTMGHGQYFNKYGYKDHVELFSNHLARVITICEKYDFSPMIWSDMYYRLSNSDREYYKPENLKLETKKIIPQNVTFVYWDYYHDDEEFYGKMFSSHKMLFDRVSFAGGAWRWSGFAPYIRSSLDRAKCSLLAAKDNGIEDVFVTAWGDNGNECTLMSIIPSLAAYSILDYEGTYSDERVDSLLRLFGEKLSNMLLLDLANQPMKKYFLPPYNPCKYLFYQDPLAGLFEKHLREEYEDNYRSYIPLLNKAKEESKLFPYIYENMANLLDFLSSKVVLGTRIRKAYDNKDLAKLDKIANTDIQVALDKLAVFNETLYTQWHKEFKPFGYDVLDGRAGYLANRLKTARRVINDYLAKRIDTIEILDEKILPHDSQEYEEVCWNKWTDGVTPHNL